MPLCSWKCVDRSKARRQRAGSNRFRPSRSKTARERHDASDLTTRKEYLKTAQTLLRTATAATETGGLTAIEPSLIPPPGSLTNGGHLTVCLDFHRQLGRAPSAGNLTFA